MTTEDKKMDVEFEANKDKMNLYSRQIGTFGVETMKHLVTLDVLIIGCKGVGAEAAKNLILAGPRSVTIYDSGKVTLMDLCANCFFNESKIGQRRSTACLPQLKVLNPYVTVSEYPDNVVLASVVDDIASGKYGFVLATDSTLSYADLAAIDNACRAANAGLTIGLSDGVTASVFSDFGANHAITDADGEPAIVNPISDMSVSENAEKGIFEVVVTVASASHRLDDGSKVIFSDIDGEGVDILNEIGQCEVSRMYIKYDGGKREKIVPGKFVVKLSAEQSQKVREHKGAFKYIGRGIATEAKPVVNKCQMSFERACLFPGMFAVTPDAEKMYAGRGSQLHFARIGIWRFLDAHNRTLPRLHNAEDAEEVAKLAKAAFEAARDATPGNDAETEKKSMLEEFDGTIAKRMALYAQAELGGISTFVGGIIAQEVVKKFGKFSPLDQWLHLDYFDLVPSDCTVPSDSAPIGTRYDSQIAVIGAAAQARLADEKWFLVGCGALGCEYIKGFALMGIGSGPNGLVHITDMDKIEVSNLNRQFLFRRENVGQLKSECAAAAARAMNPAIKIACHETKVCPETENILDDAFWTSLTGVCNALDNIEARKYVDSRCVFYERPLLESGTLGTKANSEIILPHKTACYSEGAIPDDSDGAIPMCTLRSFPYLPDHCIEWGRAQFTELFDVPPRDAEMYLKDPKGFIEGLEKEGNVAAQVEKLERIRGILRIASSPDRSFGMCIQLAAAEFYAQFTKRIRDLTYAFPEDSERKDPDTGEIIKFWSGTKRFPHPEDFDISRKEHSDYIFAAANLYAHMYRIPQVSDRAEFDRILASTKITLPTWEPPKSNGGESAMDVEDSENGNNNSTSSGGDNDAQTKNDLIKEFEAYSSGNAIIPVPAEFEKDDDTNFHIDFITACSNLRALNYHIRTSSRHQVKMVAGRIIPAIATTTAMITGAVCMEMYKLLLGLDKPKFWCANVNLAVSICEFFEPDAPGRAKAAYDEIEMENVVPVPDGFTCWDKVVVDIGDVTLKEFLDKLPEIHYGCTATYLIKSGISNEDVARGFDKPIYTDFAPTKNIKALVAANMNRKMSECYKACYGELPGNRNYFLLEGSFTSKDEELAKIPIIKFIFKH